MKNYMSSVTIFDKVVGSVSDAITPIHFALPSKHTRSVFDSESVDVLKNLYCKINPKCDVANVIVNSTFIKYRSLTLHGKIFLSSGNRIQYSANSVERNFVWVINCMA